MPRISNTTTLPRGTAVRACLPGTSPVDGSTYGRGAQHLAAAKSWGSTQPSNDGRSGEADRRQGAGQVAAEEQQYAVPRSDSSSSGSRCCRYGGIGGGGEEGKIE
jgi:hypothetical protein